MQPLLYSCKKTQLHPQLQGAWREQEASTEADMFRKRKSIFYGLKFILFVMMSVLGIRHYNIMGMLGYETYLLDEKNIRNFLREKKRKRLLDIGAGNGSITRNFESFVEQIYYREPSHSFQRILDKRGYRGHLETEENTYDIITLFNVLDVCDNPHDIIHWAIQHLKKNGEIIISLPFPIQARSWDNKKIYKTNLLTQNNKISFEEAVSNFYRDFIEKNGLTVNYFTRLPYIVSLPETQETTIYDNGFFVCKMA